MCVCVCVCVDVSGEHQKESGKNAEQDLGQHLHHTGEIERKQIQKPLEEHAWTSSSSSSSSTSLVRWLSGECSTNSTKSGRGKRTVQGQLDSAAHSLESHVQSVQSHK